MRALVLVIDGLQPAYLGCYGNSWVGTPELDRLAAESFVLDQAYLDSTSWQSLYRSYWEGKHAWQQREGEPNGVSLVDRLRAAGVTTALLTDDPAIADQSLAGDFDDILLVPAPRVDQAAESIEETQFARLIAAAADWLTRADESFLLWIHARGLSGPWDAPTALRYQYLDEVDEEEGADTPPPTEVEFLPRRLPDGFDPDALLGIRRAYAGQVAAIDTCVGALIDVLDEVGLQDTLMQLVSLRGYPLGEHGRLGHVDDSLDEELVHLAWIVRQRERIEPAVRSQALVQPADVHFTLLEHFGIEVPSNAPWAASTLPLAREEAAPLRDRALLENESGERAIRTPAWYLKLVPAVEDEDSASTAKNVRHALFRKPDDRCEVNEIANRCHDVALALERVAGASAQAADDPAAPASWQPLDDVLVEGIE
ncbi:MAG: sulfatase-like hydrolase/transferase [Pirellulales bacterium]|nr:sulfatase-like hydrolase/transferase [Pirellulales bacterium]